MRRILKLTKTAIIYLALAAIFNLSSFALDQLVVQQEDKIRNFTSNLNSQRTSMESLQHSMNTLSDLGYDIAISVWEMKTAMGFLIRASKNFHPKENRIEEYSIRQKFSNEQLYKLSNYYKEKSLNLINLSNDKIEQTFYIYDNSFSSGIAYHYLKNLKSYQHMIDKSQRPNIEKNIFENFNFDKEIKNFEKYDNDTFAAYSKFWEQIDKMRPVSDMVDNQLYKLRVIYKETYAQYLSDLDQFAEIKNTKNFYILFSIFCQILGITFILFLFKTLMKEK